MRVTPHDALFKAVLGAPERAAGVLRTIVPAEVGEAVQWQALSLCSGSFVDAALAYQHSDLLFSARWRTGQEALLYFLMEHQSSPPTGSRWRSACCAIKFASGSVGWRRTPRLQSCQ
jgi:predicted transposase/invertase (TIGR01784 family)